MNILNNDVEVGALGLYQCNDDINEVFVYGGSRFLALKLRNELRHEQSLFRKPKVAALWRSGRFDGLMYAAVIALVMAAFLTVVLPGTFHVQLGTRSTAMRRIAALCVLLAAAWLCWSLPLTIQAIDTTAHKVYLARAATEGGAVSEVDYTIRPSVATDHCFGVGDLTSRSMLSLQPCKVAKTQQFLAETDGTIRPKHNASLCLTHGSNKFQLSQCDAKDSQVFDLGAESSGKLKMRAQPDLCMNLLNGDILAGQLDLYDCGADINEVFIYSGGNVIASRIARQVDPLRR